MSIPPAYQEKLDKILAYFNLQIYPTWASRYFHTTRSAKARNQAKTYLPGARTVWATYDAVTKALWKTAGTFMKLNGWLYFTQKFSYHKKHGLTLTLTPNSTVQMFGLELFNPGGLEEVRATREDIVLLGQINAAFKYKKTENSPATTDPFRFHCDLYYFQDGENKVETHDWTAPSGNVDWTAVSESFGTTGRNYFHCVLTFYLDYYDADVFLDNFLISDGLGDVYREAWKVKDGKPWAYTPKVRKYGWIFSPNYAEPYFQIAYIDD